MIDARQQHFLTKLLIQIMYYVFSCFTFLIKLGIAEHICRLGDADLFGYATWSQIGCCLTSCQGHMTGLDANKVGRDVAPKQAHAYHLGEM